MNRSQTSVNLSRAELVRLLDAMSKQVAAADGPLSLSLVVRPRDGEDTFDAAMTFEDGPPDDRDRHARELRGRFATRVAFAPIELLEQLETLCFNAYMDGTLLGKFFIPGGGVTPPDADPSI